MQAYAIFSDAALTLGESKNLEALDKLRAKCCNNALLLKHNLVMLRQPTGILCFGAVSICFLSLLSCTLSRIGFKLGFGCGVLL